jgi:hypothetical protein
MAKTQKSEVAAGPDCPERLNQPRPTREEYVATVLQQISAFEERLDELESDMESSGWDDIGNFRGQLDDLRMRLKGIRSRSEELEAVPDSGWPEAYEEIEESLVETAGGVEDLVAGLSVVLPE